MITTLIDQVAVVMAVATIGGFVFGGGVFFFVGRWSRRQQSVFRDLRKQITRLEHDGHDKDALLAQRDEYIADLLDKRRSMRGYSRHMAVRMRQMADHMDELSEQPSARERAKKRRAS